MTKQETFNQVATHLLRQGKKSMIVDENCLYRGPGGLMCAAGCLIPDDKYDPAWEGSVVYEPIYGRNSVSACIADEGHDLELVKDLQDVHDDWEPACWRDRLRRAAAQHGLDDSILETVH